MEARVARYDVTAELNRYTSIQEFSKIFEGLQALKRAGRIRFRIRASDRAGVARVLRLRIGEQAGVGRPIAIDIADDPKVMDLNALENVEVYFKRSCRAETIDGLAQGLAQKIRPFGLNNPAIRPGTALKILGARLSTGRNLTDLAIDARQLLALPSPKAFEISPDTPAEPLILFQTRLWSPAVEDPGREEINEERASLIRALQSEFGGRFIGGAIPTDFARSHYPDVSTPLPFSMRSYPQLLRRPLIAIYSRGLRDSLAFKMTEYLAASRCIVGHRPTTLLPHPLIEGCNYLAFETPGECIARCDELLSRPNAAAAMRRSNWQHYMAHAEPSAHLAAVIESVLLPT